MRSALRLPKAYARQLAREPLKTQLEVWAYLRAVEQAVFSLEAEEKRRAFWRDLGTFGRATLRLP